MANNRGRCSDPRVAMRVSLGSVANDPAQSFSSPLNWNRRGVQGAAGEADACKQKTRRLFFVLATCLCRLKGSRRSSSYKCYRGEYKVLSCNINQPGWLGERSLARGRWLHTSTLSWLDGLTDKGPEEKWGGWWGRGRVNSPGTQQTQSWRAEAFHHLFLLTVITGAAGCQVSSALGAAQSL